MFVYFANCKKMLFCYNSICNEGVQRTISPIQKGKTMKEYICRLVNDKGFIIDGAFVTAKNKKEALEKYLIIHPYAKTDKCVFDKYTVERA